MSTTSDPLGTRAIEPKEMDGDELVTAYTLKDPHMAEIIKNALRGEGIPCELDGAGQAGLSEIFDIGVLVRAQDADLARRLIEQHERKREIAGDDWIRPER